MSEWLGYLDRGRGVGGELVFNRLTDEIGSMTDCRITVTMMIMTGAANDEYGSCPQFTSHTRAPQKGDLRRFHEYI